MPGRGWTSDGADGRGWACDLRGRAIARPSVSEGGLKQPIDGLAERLVTFRINRPSEGRGAINEASDSGGSLGISAAR